jgi:chaperonin GroEL (HSP60 family)
VPPMPITYEKLSPELMHDATEVYDEVRGAYGPSRTRRPSLRSAWTRRGLGASALCRAAARTGQLAGDGRITTILLTYAIVSEGARTLTPGLSGTAIRRGLRRGLDAALAALQLQARPASGGPTASSTATTRPPEWLPGGGVSLLRCAGAVHAAADAAPVEEAVGVRLVAAALSAPLRQLAENAGQDPDEVLAEVTRGSGAWGYDAAAARYVDLLARGIAEPARVTRMALTQGVRTASTLLLADSLLG